MQVLRQKIARAGAQRVDVAEVGTGGLDRLFRLAMARAARDAVGLTVDVTSARLDRMTLTELVEQPPDRALMVLLDAGAGPALGLMVMSQPVLAGVIERLTTGRVTATAPAPRRPTRTDAAMVAGLIDAMLAGFDPAADGAAPWRCSTFVEETRTLPLLLEDGVYQVVRADLSLADGAKGGSVLLALPEHTVRVAAGADVPPPAAAAPDFADALAAQVDMVPARLDAVIGRVTLPLARLSALLPGEVLPLPLASVDRVHLVGVDGRLVGEGRLGQARGLRALRLSGDNETVATAAPRALPTMVAAGDLSPRAVAG